MLPSPKNMLNILDMRVASLADCIASLQVAPPAPSNVDSPGFCHKATQTEAPKRRVLLGPPPFLPSMSSPPPPVWLPGCAPTQPSYSSSWQKSQRRPRSRARSRRKATQAQGPSPPPVSSNPTPPTVPTNPASHPCEMNHIDLN